MKQINIITRCSRPENVLKVRDSIFHQGKKVNWYVFFDTYVVKELDAFILHELQESGAKVFFRESIKHDLGHQFINEAFSMIDDGWIYILDDDNLLHENFFPRLEEEIESHPDKLAFVFNQQVGGNDFSGLNVRTASPENMKVQHVDMAQWVINRSLIGDSRLRLCEYKADGYFIEELYNLNPDKFHFIDEVLCYYNQLSEKRSSLPKVLVLGQYIHSPICNSEFTTDDKVVQKIAEFDPDAIISVGQEWASSFPNLTHQPEDIRRRWVHIEEPSDILYKTAMNYILSEKNMLSFFTPMYNTGETLRRTYRSLQEQTYQDWEWVLVDDSTDKETLQIAKEIAANDPRVKVYDIYPKTGGIIGEAKYRAACLCRGKWIAELDHDDFLMDDAASLIVKAFNKYPECKFVYSDYAEVDPYWNPLTYGETFGYGYGTYRKELHNEVEYMVTNYPNINPRTIRHIVGVPNHIRVWEKEFYMSIGGHNRRLTIADDYELLVRTFLQTRFVCIRHLCYIQVIGSSNTQHATRDDIQRRVYSISSFYNEQIKQRFEELGMTDWVYEGKEDTGEIANYIMYPYD